MAGIGVEIPLTYLATVPDPPSTLPISSLPFTVC